MGNSIFTQIIKKFLWSGLFFILVLTIGTTGYHIIGGDQYSLIDCLYMTMITISTIGFGEIVDLSHHPEGRVFTMFIAFSGIGILTYFLSNFTAFIVEGQMKETFRRNKMEKRARSMKGHFIVCGVGKVGRHILKEIIDTNRSQIIIDNDKAAIEKRMDILKDRVVIHGDATDNNILIKAGIANAEGIFAVTGDDNQNLVIALTAKQLNPEVKVVARCKELNNVEKVKKAGADAVISPDYIGALRMASEMFRPAVVSFLDIMLRDKDKNLRIEEVTINRSFNGKALSSLKIENYPNTLLLALIEESDWIYNPPQSRKIKSNDKIIVMTTPEDRMKLQKNIGA
ncbi:MAG: potassium channel family protein [Candidatus Zhuqueibacterota bacterium]